MNDTSTVNDKPKKVQNAVRLLILSLILGFINSVISEFYSEMKLFSSTEGLVTLILTYGILGFLIYYINERKNWARIVSIIMMGLGLLVFPFSLAQIFKENALNGTISLVSALIQIVAYIMLLSKESNLWFKNTLNPQ